MHTQVTEAEEVLEGEESVRGIGLVGSLVGGEAVVEENHEDGEAAGEVEAWHVAATGLRGIGLRRCE